MTKEEEVKKHKQSALILLLFSLIQTDPTALQETTCSLTYQSNEPTMILEDDNESQMIQLT